MNKAELKTVSFVLVAVLWGAGALAQIPSPSEFTWWTVVNNSYLMPTDDIACKPTPQKPMPPRRCYFNSYNQPSVNVSGLVVIRARSKGGGGMGGGEGQEGTSTAAAGEGEGGSGTGSGEEKQPVHGIYTRDMGVEGSPIVRILDRSTEVPQPNNTHYPPTNLSPTTFVETPSFPRIDMWSNTIATRGNHQPVWRYGVYDDVSGTWIETRAGTTGIYTNPFGDLITGAAKLGMLSDFEFWAVPGAPPGTMFDVFPGAPSVTDGQTIVFKGNYTVDGFGRTGVFYRDLEELAAGFPGGEAPVVLIANSTDTFIPGTKTVFGSTSPPSAVGREAVFAGFDNEENPTKGGLYLAALQKKQKLTTLVRIGQKVPGEWPHATFNRLGEGVAFDGDSVAFWGAWGTETTEVKLYCPTEGNKDRIAYCNQNLVCEDGHTEKDENSDCSETIDPAHPICYQNKEIPVHQGIFVYDLENYETRMVARTEEGFHDFVFWNYSGKTPCVGSGGHGQEGAEDDGEPARWRSSAFVSVSGPYTAFKAQLDDGLPGHDVVGIYLDGMPGQDPVTVLDTTMAGQVLDLDAPADALITELGLEREGLRGEWLAVSAKMGAEGTGEHSGTAGIYLTRLPSPKKP